MTQREDLERLAGECEVCAMADTASIDSHMIICPSCVEHRVKADHIAGEVESLRTLADLDDLERRHILGYSINDYLNMSEARRADAMRNLFENIADLEDEKRTLVIRTRTELLTSLPKQERDKLLSTARKVYSHFPPEMMERERRDIERATASLNPLKRTMVRRMYRELM